MKMDERTKLSVVALSSMMVFVLTVYFHLILNMTTVFTHFFYIPIVLASIWYHYKGTGLTMGLLLFLFTSDIVHGSPQNLLEDGARGAVMLVVSFVVATISLQADRLRTDLASSNASLEERVRSRTAELSASNDALNSELQNRDVLEKMLVEEKERLQVMLLSIAEAVITTDSNGRVTLMNPAAEELFGIHLADAVGRPSTEIAILRFGPCEGGEDPVEHVLATGEVWSDSDYHIFSRPDGTRKVLAISSAPIMVGDEPKGTILAFSDVTEQEHLREDWARLKKIEAMELLAGGIAHDFNNILTAIAGRVLMASHDLPADSAAVRQLVEAERGINRATELTRQLQNFAKTGSPVKGGVAVPALIRESTEFILSNSAINRTYEMSHDLWPVALDSIRLGQIVSNLVINAKEAMPKGGIIHIAAGNENIEEGEMGLKQGEYVHLVVQDEGIGIPPEALDHIFEPYFTTKPYGSGLGLAIVNSIVVKHGGAILIDSKVGKGTKIDVYLPAWRNMGGDAKQ